MNTRQQEWTPGEDVLIRKLRDEGEHPDKIGNRIGRTSQSVYCRLSFLKKTPEQRLAVLRSRVRQPKNKPIRTRLTLVVEPTAIVIPAEAIADRDRRINLPRNIMGDPPAGYSALDRRVAEQVQP
jgi:hypothetical protein